MAICAKYLLLLVMAQLDLFGNVIPPSKPTKTSAKAATILPEKPAEDAIFVNNGNAGFKVKLKTPATTEEALVNDSNLPENIKESVPIESLPEPIVAELVEEPLPAEPTETLPTHSPQEIEQVTIESDVEEAPHLLIENLPAADDAVEQEPIVPADISAANDELAIADSEGIVEPIHTPDVTNNSMQEVATADYLPYPPTVPLETAGKRGRLSFKEMEESAKLLSVPSKEELYQKQYYSISTVASWFNVNISLLRFWENEFDIIQPRKTRKGDRLFRPQDVENLQIIHYLLRIRKFSIQGAKQYLEENKNNIDTQVFLQQTLQNFKIFLTELKANLES